MAGFGEYKGKRLSPDTVKFKVTFQGVPIHVDRPKGFVMRGVDPKGQAWERKYKYDYGFIPKTIGGDDDGLDVFIGPDKAAPEAYWAFQRKEDGSFDEYKIFLGFPNREAAISAYKEHIPFKLFNGLATMKLDMMRAMLGIAPLGPKPEKLAMVLGCFDEFKKIAEWKDQIRGGLADAKKPSDFDSRELARGAAVEREHTRDPQAAKEIAMDHLTETPKYYQRLAKVEKHS